MRNTFLYPALTFLFLLAACSHLSKNIDGDLTEYSEGKYSVQINGVGFKFGNPYVRLRPWDSTWKDTMFENSSSQERKDFLTAKAKEVATEFCKKNEEEGKLVKFPSKPIELKSSHTATFKQSKPYGIDQAFTCGTAESFATPTAVPSPSATPAPSKH